jgi:DNA polymerase-1
LRPYDVVVSEGSLARIAREIEQTDVVSLDLETAQPGGGGSVDPLTGRIRLVSVNTQRGIYLIDLYQTRTLGPVREALANTKAVVVGQNLKFDQKWLLWHYDLELLKIFDTFRASSIIYAGLPGLTHDLWSLYKRELGETAQVEDLGNSDWDGPLTKQQLDYAADDVDKLPRLRTVLRQKLIDAGLVRTAQLEFNAVLPESMMELNGFYLDQSMWKTRTDDDTANMIRLRDELHKELPNPSAQFALPGMVTGINLDSPDQVLRSLRMLGIKQKIKDPETGLTTVGPLADTKEMTLMMVADRYPVLKKFIEYRGYAQSVKSFGMDYLRHVHPGTKRIHSSYFPYTDTGRYANRGPNLQQVPRGKAFRDCFRAEEGRLLAICDWSNIEMRLVAEISKDPVLIKVFQDGRDAHYATASLVTGRPESAITKPERQQAKPVNFGFIYGMQAAKLVLYAKGSYGVTMTEQQARTFRRKFFEAYAGIAGWHSFALDSGKRRRETRTLWGRRRIIKDEKAHNEFYNSPVQGSGADGLKNTIRLVYDRLKALNGGRPPLLGKGAAASMVHMVHDEIVLEHNDDPELTPVVQGLLQKTMIDGIGPMMTHVPTEAEVGGGRSWAAK